MTPALLRDRGLDRECVKVVLRHRLGVHLDAYYGGWKSPKVAERSREALLDEVADDVLQMLHLEQPVVAASEID